MAAIHTLAKL